jgi:hypothetical protein
MHWQAWPPEEGPSEGEGRPSRCYERRIGIVTIKLMPVVVVLLSCCYPVAVAVIDSYLWLCSRIMSRGSGGCRIVAWGCGSAVSRGGGGGSGGSLFSSEMDQLMLQRTNVPLVSSNIQSTYLSTGFIIHSDHH